MKRYGLKTFSKNHIEEIKPGVKIIYAALYDACWGIDKMFWHKKPISNKNTKTQKQPYRLWRTGYCILPTINEVKEGGEWGQGEGEGEWEEAEGGLNKWCK